MNEENTQINQPQKTGVEGNAFSKLVSQKLMQLEDSKRANTVSAGVTATVGAIAGGLIGFGTMVVALIRRSTEHMAKKNVQRANYLKPTSKAEEVLLRESVEIMQKENSLAGFITRNPRGFMLGSIITGAAVGLGMNISEKKKQQEHIRQDLRALDQLAADWRDRVRLQQETQHSNDETPSQQL